MKNLSKILMVFTLVATLIYSCTKSESNELDESSELIYKKDISLAEQDYEHYRSINSIEKISKNNSDLKAVIDKANISIDTSTDILKYTFENNVTAYKISDVYIQ